MSRRTRTWAMAAVIWISSAGLALADGADELPGARYLAGEDARIRQLVALENAGTRISTAPARNAMAARPPERRGAGRSIDVRTSAALVAALASALPGDVIRLADGIYRGNFVAARSGTADAPIVLWGTRGAILDGGDFEKGYGFHLRASHWVLEGFTVRNALKGIMADGACHNRLAGLEVHDIGEEGVHFRAKSSDNRLEGSWIHDVGRDTPLFGEGVYVGSAANHWLRHAAGRPDACDGNQVIGNVLGPGITAEAVDVKEGVTGGEIRANLILDAGRNAADSWIDLKGNGCTVRSNTGTSNGAAGRPLVAVHALRPGWGLNNVVGPHRASRSLPDAREPYRVAFGRGPATLVLPARALRYTTRELAVRFPGTVECVTPGTAFLKEHLFLGPRASLSVGRDGIRELRLQSAPSGFVSVVGARAAVRMDGTAKRRVRIRSWDPAASAADAVREDGRAYVTILGGRMDLAYVDATDLGFGTGRTSGVAWKGRGPERCRGNVTSCRFERNHFGAYTFQSEAMRWVDNLFAKNFGYGFDPHDFSDRFVVTGNVARFNGSHGIIFSRGCNGNLLRGNLSHSNRGHGIMMDDGKVARDGDPRHAKAVPSNDNRLVDNEAWGNKVGIAFQGGRNNVVAGNRLHKNHHGIRLEGQASGNQITDNEIRENAMFGIHVYNGSDQNRIVDNRIDGGQGGIVVKQSVDNVLERNRITRVRGKGIVLAGAIGASGVSNNLVSGRGSRAITASGDAQLHIEGNRTERWMPARNMGFASVLWGTILALPVAMGLPTRWSRIGRSRNGRRARRLVVALALGTLASAIPAPLLAMPTRSLALEAGISTTYDDNILRYSHDQIRDLGSGQHPYRFGISRVGDVVFHPSLGIAWHGRSSAVRRRSLRLEVDGDVHRRNGIADFGTLGLLWRESFAGDRRVTVAYARTPDAYLRRLYDDDLATLPTSDRYRDASVDLHTASLAWRQRVPRASWGELEYRYDRRRHAAAFRERDSDTHKLELGAGWERLPRGGRLQASVAGAKRAARAEDGLPSLTGLPDEPDMSFRTLEAELAGGLDLASGIDWRLAADGRVEAGWRRFDSHRPADRSHYGRNDRILGFELGLRLLAGRHWSARGFYRHEANRAHYGAGAPAGSEFGGYRVNQTGLELRWSGDLWTRPQELPNPPRP